MDKDSFAVVLSGVKKKIGGNPILRGIDLKVRYGSIHVIAGPNGAGKTTTIRVILGLVKPDEGEVIVLGYKPGSPAWVIPSMSQV